MSSLQRCPERRLDLRFRLITTLRHLVHSVRLENMKRDAGSQQATTLLLAHNLPDLFGRGAQGRIIQMRIPRRCLWTTMTEQRADDFKARATLNRKGCERMSKIVDPEILERNRSLGQWRPWSILALGCGCRPVPDTAVKVDITPSHRQDFGFPRAGHKQDLEYRSGLLIGNLVQGQEEAVQFSAGQISFSWALGITFDADGRVRFGPTPFPGKREKTV